MISWKLQKLKLKTVKLYLYDWEETLWKTKTEMILNTVLNTEISLVSVHKEVVNILHKTELKWFFKN